jgi:hypothetical protein
MNLFRELEHNGGEIVVLDADDVMFSGELEQAERDGLLWVHILPEAGIAITLTRQGRDYCGMKPAPSFWRHILGIIRPDNPRNRPD